MASSDWQIAKPQRGRPKAELPDVNIKTGGQSILLKYWQPLKLLAAIMLSRQEI